MVKQNLKLKVLLLDDFGQYVMGEQCVMGCLAVWSNIMLK